MAVAYSNNTNTDIRDVTNIDLAVPSGYASGNLLLASIVIDTNYLDEITTPSGWTKLDSEVNGTALTHDVYYKIASASETSPVNFGTISAADKWAAAMWLVTGNDTNVSTVINASSVNTGTDTAPTASSITTDKDGCLILWVGGSDGERTFTPPTSFTERYDQGPTASSGNCTGTGADWLQTSSGSTGSLAGTLSASAAWIFRAIAIAPSTAAVTPIPPKLHKISRQFATIIAHRLGGLLE